MEIKIKPKELLQQIADTGECSFLMCSVCPIAQRAKQLAQDNYDYDILSCSRYVELMTGGYKNKNFQKVANNLLWEIEIEEMLTNEQQ